MLIILFLIKIINSYTPINSLVKHRNLQNRVSSDNRGIQNKQIQIDQQLDLGQIISQQNMYFFDFFDQNINGYLNCDEIIQKCIQYQVIQITDLENYIQKQFIHYDKDQDQKLNRVEFNYFIEDLWKQQSIQEKNNCNFNIQNSIDVAENLFDQLDIEKKSKISRLDVEHGLYFLFKYTINKSDLEYIFESYGIEQAQFLDQKGFLYSFANGNLFKNLEDSTGGLTFS